MPRPRAWVPSVQPNASVRAAGAGLTACAAPSSATAPSAATLATRRVPLATAAMGCVPLDSQRVLRARVHPAAVRAQLVTAAVPPTHAPHWAAPGTAAPPTISARATGAAAVCVRRSWRWAPRAKPTRSAPLPCVRVVYAASARSRRVCTFVLCVVCSGVIALFSYVLECFRRRLAVLATRVLVGCVALYG